MILIGSLRYLLTSSQEAVAAQMCAYVVRWYSAAREADWPTLWKSHTTIYDLLSDSFIDERSAFRCTKQLRRGTDRTLSNTFGIVWQQPCKTQSHPQTKLEPCAANPQSYHYFSTTSSFSGLLVSFPSPETVQRQLGSCFASWCNFHWRRRRRRRRLR